MLPDPTLLDVWDRGGGRSPLWQALLLLEAAHPETSAEALAALPVGHRDGLLLDLRERVFGRHLESVAGCPRCGEWLELAVTTADLRQTPAAPGRPLAVDLGDYSVTFRLPTTADLLALASDDADGALPPERLLLARCLTRAERGGERVKAADLPGPVAEKVSEQMEAADPQANVTLALTCPACDHAWERIFDVGTFLWSELDAWARRVLGEVHVLASAYGWTEREVLGLSARRRALYLQRVLG